MTPTDNLDRASVQWPEVLHPINQAHLWIGNIPLYDPQIDILIAAAVSHSRVIVSTSNEFGKTSILGKVFLLSIAATFRGAMCHATSGNEEQLRAQLFAMLKEVALRNKWQVNETSMLITLPNESTIRCSVRKDAESVEGFHGYDDPRGFYRPCAYFLDECKHIPNAKEQAVRRIDPDFYLGLSTPPTEMDANMNWFWNGINKDALDRIIRERQRKLAPPLALSQSERISEAHQRPSGRILFPDPLYSFPGEYFTYRRIITWENIPHLHTPERQQERDNIIKKYGKKSSFVRSMLFGEASEGDVKNPIFSEDDIDLMRKAMARDPEFKPQHGDTRSAADVSGTGETDPMVLGLRNGTEVLWLEERMGYDDIAQAEYLVNFNRSLKLAPYQFCIDGMGIGASIANRMEQTLKFHGLTRFLANNDPTYDFQFDDRYSELHWMIRDLLSYRVLICPWCPNLLRDMRERRYVIMAGNKIKCEPKEQHRKRTGHSPDFLDTMVYLFSDFPMDRIRRNIPLTASEISNTDPNGPWKQHLREVDAKTKRIMPQLRKQPRLSDLMGSRTRLLPPR